MPTLRFDCELNAPLEAVWAFHDSIDTLFLLTPPHTKVTLDGEPEPMRPGVIFHLRMRRMGVPLRWDAEIVEFAPPDKFVDRQVKGRGPFAAWEHRHLFRALPNNRTLLTDEVTYTPPFGPLGKLADLLFLRRDITAMFAHRHRVTRESLEKK